MVFPLNHQMMLVLWINKHGRCVTITQSYITWMTLTVVLVSLCLPPIDTEWIFLVFTKIRPIIGVFAAMVIADWDSKIWNLTDWLYVILKEKLLFEWAHHRLKRNYAIGTPIMIGRHYSHYEQFILPESMRFFYLTGGGGCCPYLPNQNGARLSNTI